MSFAKPHINRIEDDHYAESKLMCAAHNCPNRWSVSISGLCSAHALAQPEQEPVAWGMMNDDGKIYDCICPEEHDRVEGEYTVPLYTTPPHRKPLTDEEIDKLPWEPHESNPMTFAEGLRYFARAIEAAHGIKE